MQFRVFWENLSGNAGKVNGIVAALEREIFARAGSGISWEVVNEHHSLLLVFLLSTVFVRVLTRTCSQVNQVHRFTRLFTRFSLARIETSVIY